MEKGQKSLILTRLWLAGLTVGLAYALLAAGPVATAEDLASVRTSVSALEGRLSTVEIEVAVNSRDLAIFLSEVDDMYLSMGSLQDDIGILQEEIDGPFNGGGLDSRLTELRDCVNVALHALESNMLQQFAMWVVPRC